MSKKEIMFNFVSQSLVDVDFSRQPFLEQSQGIDCQPEMRLGHSYQAKTRTAKVEMSVRLLPGQAPFSFAVTIEGIFKFNAKINKAELSKVCQVNCASILFPFLREFVADITRRSGNSQLLLPPVNFVSLYENQIETKAGN